MPAEEAPPDLTDAFGHVDVGGPAIVNAETLRTTATWRQQ
jgi:hypothetical protein